MPKKLEDEIGAAVTADNPKYAGKSAAYINRLRYDLRKLAKGECLWSGCKAICKTRYCEVHLVRRRSNWNRAYLKRKQKALNTA